jgi:hypothetical protein
LAKFSPPGNNLGKSTGTHTKDFDDFFFPEIVVSRQWVPVGCQNIAGFLTCFIFFSGL